MLRNQQYSCSTDLKIKVSRSVQIQILLNKFLEVSELLTKLYQEEMAVTDIKVASLDILIYAFYMDMYIGVENVDWIGFHL